MTDTPAAASAAAPLDGAGARPSGQSAEGARGIEVLALATRGPGAPFETTTLRRREPRPRDVLIDIAFAGVCHSDVHHARAEWGSSLFPLVPGHEITGTVAAVGGEATRFAVGDRVGVGCLVDACGACEACAAGEEQYCDRHVLTYNALDRDGEPTHGGYSERVVVDERFVVRVPDALGLAAAAPLMCAGITLYSPLARWDAGPGTRLDILGLGGLGHLGVQIAAARGARTTVFEIDPGKRADALRLGADDVVVTARGEAPPPGTGPFDLLVSTVPVPLDLDAYLGLLALGGTFVNLGVPPRPLSVVAHSLLRNRRCLTGSLIGGIAETQRMLDFCADTGVACEVEVIGAGDVDAAYDRLVRGDVRYRFVIDVATIARSARPGD